MDSRTYYYARVSTKDQNLDRQISVFKALGATEREIITDKESGKNLDRSGYQALKNTILRRGDTLVIKSLDRLSRSKNDIHNELKYYKENAKIIGAALTEMGIEYVGGENSPYVWLKCPNGMKSWDFFDLLLKEANVVGTPGVGFGNNGEGYFRLTSFGDRENVIKAVERIKKLDCLK